MAVEQTEDGVALGWREILDAGGERLVDEKEPLARLGMDAHDRMADRGEVGQSGTLRT